MENISDNKYEKIAVESKVELFINTSTLNYNN